MSLRNLLISDEFKSEKPVLILQMSQSSPD